MRAIQLFVRGFHSEELGDKIIAKLQDIGFSVDLACAGESDDLGGIIETHITPVDQLSVEAETIKAAIHAIDPDTPIFVQWRIWQCVDEYNT
jgi:hypothetical protein